MSREQFSHGVEIIAAEARKNDLVLGSRAVDEFREVARLSFEKTVELGGRQQLRTPTFEFSQEFIEDLPTTLEYKAALADFLRSLSLHWSTKTTAVPNVIRVPVELEIHWPFRPVQTSDDFFIHVLARVGSPWSNEANFTIALSGIDKSAMGISSLSPPTIERFVVNAIRFAIDQKRVEFYPVGRHPTTLQPVRIEPSAQREVPTDVTLKEYLKRKVYWLGFREGDDRTRVTIADPYDKTYLVQSPHRIRQIALVANAAQEIKLDSTGEFALATDALLMQADAFENELEAMIRGKRELSGTSDDDRKGGVDKSDPTVFISYSTEDAPFAKFLFKSLEERGIKVWLDEREIRVGDSLTTRIGDAVRLNDFMVVVLSPASVRSEWVRKELAEAMNKEIRQKRVVVLPVIYRRCEIPPFLTDKKYADFTTDSDSALQGLVRSIERHHTSNAG